jgi:hypothetical protein
VPIEPEAQAPLRIDPDAVLALPITFERFQLIVRWNPQIIQAHGPVQHLQLALGHRPDIDKLQRWPTFEQRLGACMFERTDHA